MMRMKKQKQITHLRIIFLKIKIYQCQTFQKKGASTKFTNERIAEALDQNENNIVLGNNSNSITAWHDINNAPLNNYDHPHIQALAFPTLFPFSCGNATNRDRRKYISMTDSNKHILKCCFINNETNLPRCPFADNNRWCHWAKNIVERCRINSQRLFYQKKIPRDANITEEEFRKTLQDKGE